LRQFTHDTTVVNFTEEQGNDYRCD